MRGGDDGQESAPDRPGDLTQTHTSDDLPGTRPAHTAPASSTPSPPGGSLSLTSVPSEFYEIEAEVGRGGVGIVVRALDRRLGRKVALKQLQHPGLHARQRFEREMRITARLQHPGVVPIHEAGSSPTGEPFYAMKLVEGRSLKELIAERASVAERLALLPSLLAVTETMAYAHSVGIIHRDLKPSNVIVGAYGETIVIDWGLAKDLSEPEDAADEAGPYRSTQADGLTLTGQIIGTPTYMPIEQASGGTVDQRADVYALGAILRQLLTGTPPYPGTSSQEVLRSVLAAPPPELTDVAPEAPRDLAAVARKAMAREASARYADASELLVDLKHFLNGRLVSAYSYAPAERLRKWAARRRGVLATAAIAALLLLGFGALAFSRIVSERDAAVASRMAMANERNGLIREQAARELDQGNAIRAFEILKAYPKDATDWDKVYPLVHRIGLVGLPNFWAKSEIVAGTHIRIAISPSRQVGVASAARLEVWDTDAGRLDYSVALGGDAQATVAEVEAITLGTSRYFAVATLAGDLVVAEKPAQGTEVPIVRRYRPCGDAKIWDTSALADRPTIAIACLDGKVFALNVESGDVSLVTVHAGAARAVTFLRPDLIVSSGEDQKLRWTTIGPGAGASTDRGLDSPIAVLATRPGCGVVVGGNAAGRLIVASLAGADRPREYLVDAGARVKQLGIDDSCQLAFGLTITEVLVVVDLATGERLHTSQAKTARFYPGRRAIVTASLGEGRIEYRDLVTGWKQGWRPATNPLRLLEIAPDGTIGTFADHVATYSPGRVPVTYALQEPGSTLAVSGDESLVFVGGARGGVGVVDVDRGVVSEHPAVHQGTAFVKLGGERAFYSVGKLDGCVHRWWDENSPELLACLPGGALAINTLGEDRVYIGSQTGRVLGYDQAAPGRPRLTTGYANLQRIGVDDRGDRVIVATASGMVAFLDQDLVEVKRVDAGHPMGVASALASGVVVAVTDDGQLLNLEGPRHLGAFPSLVEPCGGSTIRSSFATTGDRVVSGCGDGSVITWPEIPGLRRLGHPQMANDVDSSADGAVVAACSKAGTVTVIDATARVARGATASASFYNLEYLPSKGYLVTATSDLAVLAIWKVSEMAIPYPLDDSDVYAWLHKD